MLQENRRNWTLHVLAVVGVADVGKMRFKGTGREQRVALEEGFARLILLPTM
jgi:hypothetical protein